MAELARAAVFVESNGDALERARMRSLLHGEAPPPDALAEIRAAQRSDGGFAPIGTSGASSLETTCVRLAQLDDLPHGAVQWVVERALDFLAAQQRDDDPWGPDDEAARLFLTASCAFWLGGEAGRRASATLAAAVDENGRLPSFLEAHWLAVPVLRRTWRGREAARICRYLATRVDELHAGSLAWLANTLGPGEPVAANARTRFARLQRDDGSWANDVQATLAAVHTLTG